MPFANRKAARQALAAGLGTGMTTAQAVYRYQIANLNQQSPVVRVFSTSSDRPGFLAGDASQGKRTKFRLTVQMWVLYTDGGSWTEESAEDALDTLEQELVTWIGANQVTANWTSLRYDGPSRIGVFTVGGQSYLVEEVDVIADVFG